MSISAWMCMHHPTRNLKYPNILRFKILWNNWVHDNVGEMIRHKLSQVSYTLLHF